ncbi:negative regulation of ubiquitin-protein transferase activity [Orobanche gracilis]
MPEARDRLSRQDDVVASYSRRRVSTNGGRSTGGVGSIIFVLEDGNEGGRTPGTPFRWVGAAMVGTPGRNGLPMADGDIGTPGTGRRAAPIVGRENLSPAVRSGRRRVRGGVLPNWYPRRPLNDITAVVRAIERSTERHRIGGHRIGENQQTESPVLQDLIFHDPPVSTLDAQLEHDTSLISRFPTISKTRCPTTIGKVPNILLDITHQNNGDSDFLTPQKKLLKNIDTVEKVVMDELRKLKRTPIAKREERQKRVRTLMSMR